MSLASTDRPLLDCKHCEHRSLRMFCNLDEQALAHYASIGAESNFPKGTTLFREHGEGNRVFVVCTGQVKLFCTSKEGKDAHSKDCYGWGRAWAGGSDRGNPL